MTTTSPETITFKIKDEVTINSPRYNGKVYVIAEVKRTKAIIKPKGQPNARGLDAPMNMLRHYDPSAPMPTVMPTAVQIPIITRQVGEIVRLSRPFHKNTTSTLMVVTKINQTTVSLDPLGGPQNGTPMRSGAKGLVSVDLASILG